MIMIKSCYNFFKSTAQTPHNPGKPRELTGFHHLLYKVLYNE
ncbi:hypothetical protein CKO_01226 [Citrobacter koseri ATCC BAA-895]|uniref:Uncharacterized protein n=1 Tax=Citrobacter koseri (strain ATCC BAA-895 / CDC 4225-83 / SGSC4696) TaxID=290338 RepID=A8AFV3_CITK8|nr:hypothetical protein CKO_01226 [Citrobacter koseri ATCC BAA-895]